MRLVIRPFRPDSQPDAEGPRRPSRRRPRLAGATAAVLGLGAAGLGGCALTSPYFDQAFDHTASPVPIQGWTTDKARPVTISCSKASHAGLYPAFGPETWLTVATLAPSSQPSYDPKGGVIHGVGVRQPLPADCWHADGAYSPPRYMTALRMTQPGADGSTSIFRVFSAAGLECLGTAIGKEKSWSAWIQANCALTYSNSPTALPWVRIVAPTLGAAPMSLPRAPSAPSIRDDAPDAATMGRAFEAEARADDWAGPMEKRLAAAIEPAVVDGSRLGSIDCRLTMCRITMVYRDPEAEGRFAAAVAPTGLFSNDGENGRRYADKADEGIGASYYLARDDHRLPGAKAR